MRHVKRGAQMSYQKRCWAMDRCSSVERLRSDKCDLILLLRMIFGVVVRS